MSRGERGSVTLLLAFSVLALATVAVFALHRNLLREWAMEGDALQGARAGLAADAALAWFLAEWTTPAPGLPGGLQPDLVLAVPAGVLPEAPPWRVEGDVRVRFLGELPGAPDPGLDAWRLTLQGRVQVRSGGRIQGTYTQTRQAYVVTPRGGAGARPALRAWRVVR